MAKTLLDGVNEVLKRNQEIAGDSGSLTTLTDSARQHYVDVAVQVWNEGIEELYSRTNLAFPNEQAENTITLVTGTRAYALQTDLVQMRWPMIDKTNNQYIFEYRGTYQDLLVLDPEQDDTGLPLVGVIRPTDGLLHLDRDPTAADNGKIYTYQYDKDVSLSVAASAMPFSDAVFRAMVPVVAQLWKRDIKKDFDTGIFGASLGRAGRLLTQKQPETSWNPRG